MHEDNMKKLQGGCVSWLVLLTGAAQLLLVCGENFSSPGIYINSHCRPVGVMLNAYLDTGVYLSLGSTNITNNTDILITDIGDDTEGGLPSLTCHTDLTQCCRSEADNNGNGDLGQWTQSDGNVVLNNAMSQANGYTLYIVRNAPQVIKLARRRNLITTFNLPFSLIGSYCCTIQDMSLCANLGEWFLQYSHLIQSTIPFQLCACLSLP